MSNIHPAKKENTSRRKILGGLGLLSMFPILSFGWFNKKKEVVACAPETSTKMIKFLTQDGTLVEVDATKINKGKGMISNRQLQSWVKKEL